jgi:hypothetical protein
MERVLHESGKGFSRDNWNTFYMKDFQDRWNVSYLNAVQNFSKQLDHVLYQVKSGGGPLGR